jgi:hypothetical protein
VIPIAVPIAIAVLGQLTKGFGETQAAKADAEIARRNAKLARMQASGALNQGAADAGRVRSAGTQVLADQQVAVGNNNADLGSGSALNLFSTTRAQNALDVATVRSNAAQKAWGLEAEAQQHDFEAEQAKRRGKLAPISGILGGAGNIMSIFSSR